MIAWIGLAICAIGVGLMIIASVHWRIPESVALSGLIALFVGVILLCIGASILYEDEKNACENVGGKYVVVDTETTVISTGDTTTTSNIDIYGCVKE